MDAVGWKDLRDDAAPEESSAVRDRVLEARARAAARRSGAAGFRNADLEAAEIATHCALDHAGSRLLERAVERVGLSVRAVHRGLRVARTIADLAGRERVAAAHLSEALSLRAPALDVLTERAG
jgi:magnesium chelatase family protein